MLERPPLRYRLPYRLVGRRLPDAYRPWVVKDVNSRGYFLKRSIYGALGITIFCASVPTVGALLSFITGEELTFPPFRGLLIIFALALAAIGLSYLLIPPMRRKIRREALLQHRYTEDGTEIILSPPPPHNPTPGWRYRS